LTELWTKQRKEFLFAVGMVSFLMAGLLFWAFPKNPEPPAARTEQTEQTKKAAVSPAPKGEETRFEEEQSEEERAGEKRPEEQWFLYITGSVRKPGVYRLPPGSRLVHLVDAAGGMNNFADPAAVNLAAPLEDGTHVHIPKKGERAPERTLLLEVPLSPAAVPGQRAKPGGSGLRAPSLPKNGNPSGKSNSSQNGNPSGAIVDVNRATEEELIGLKGIGPVLAKSIVEYRRKNGPFKNVEELVYVRGIGLKKLEGFRGRVVARP
jgi:competence protein ComEA